jgi:DNA-directed RNA polymerase specialized sigma24 family protein
MRTITPEAFACLLGRLDSDPDRAAAEYEKLRRALEKFFDWRGSPSPDESADETLDRLVTRLGNADEIDDVRRFAYGIARLVLLEEQRRRARLPMVEHAERSYLPGGTAKAEDDPLHDCFEACLARLPGEARGLVLGYYVAEGQAKIDNRQRLAREAGLSNTALRSRVHRLRERLERCTQQCTATADSRGLDEALRHVTALPDTLERQHSDGD